MKKFVSTSLIIGMLAVFLTSCYPAIINTKMELNDDGSGKRTFIAEILKDGVPSPDNPTDPAKNVAGMFTDPGYFPSGMQAAVNYLNTVKPAAISTIAMEEKADRYVMTFTMNFSSILDFNTKMKTLTTGINWVTDDIAESTFVKTDPGNNKSTFTYTEDISLVNVSTLWMSNALWNSPVAQKVFDKAYAQGQFNWEKHFNDETLTQYAMFFTNDVIVAIEGQEHLFPKNSTEITFAATVNNPVSATPTPIATAAVTATPTSSASRNPVTQDSFGFAIVIIMIFTAGVVFVSMRKTANSKG